MDAMHKSTADRILHRVLDGAYYTIDGFRVYAHNGIIHIGSPVIYFDAPYDVVLNFIIWAIDNGKYIEELDE